jgi:hypothetical protein
MARLMACHLGDQKFKIVGHMALRGLGKQGSTKRLVGCCG